MEMNAKTLSAALGLGGTPARAALASLRKVARAHHGELISIARVTGIAHRTLCRWLHRWPDFAEVVREARDR